MPSPESEALLSRKSRLWRYLAFAAILFAAAGVRIIETSSWRKTGFDELVYRRYLTLMDGGNQRVAIFQKDMSVKLFDYQVKGSGAGAIPSITRLYLRTQAMEGTECELPPTRFFYIYASWLWQHIRFGDAAPVDIKEIGAEWRNPPSTPDRSRDIDHRDPPLRALHEVALICGILLVFIAGIFGIRMLGFQYGLAVMAIVSFDPILIHLSQHAMIDGVFTLWALVAIWTTWENLRNPNKTGWLVAHTIAIALMVTTKENALFVFCALAAVVTLNRWMRFGTVTTRFIAASFIGGAVGVGMLMVLAGGVGAFIETFETFISKAQDLEFVRLHGDGPWYRYLIDLLIVNPIVFLLAVGGIFACAPRSRRVAYFAVFLGASYILMASLRYGANLRFATIWTFPLAVLALAMLRSVARVFRNYRIVGLTIMVLSICAFEYRQFTIFATNPKLPFYEITPGDLLRHLNVLKD